MNKKQRMALFIGLAIAVLVVFLQPVRTSVLDTSAYSRMSDMDQFTARLSGDYPTRLKPDSDRNLMLLAIVVLGTAGTIYAFRNEDEDDEAEE